MQNVIANIIMFGFIQKKILIAQYAQRNDYL